MSASILSARERCDAFCYDGGSSYGANERGAVFRCEHGVIRFCWRSGGWGYWSSRQHGWQRLSPFWNPIRHRRALRVLREVALDGQ